MPPCRTSGRYFRVVTANSRTVSPLAILLAVCCCLTAVSGQWIEKRIQMPDSFYGMTTFAPLVYSPVSQMVYVGGECNPHGVSVTGVDVRTWTKQAQIPCNDFPAKGMGYNPLDDKLYILSDVVTIARCGNNSVLTVLSVPSGPRSFGHNQRYDKVYVGSNSNLTVIDGVGDSILQTIALGGSPSSPVSNESLGKVYFLAGAGRILVLDASADTLVAAISTPGAVRGLCLSPDGLKLYCGRDDALNPGLFIVDCVADTIARFLPLPSPALRLCCATSSHKLYCGSFWDDSTIVVVDTDGDSVMASVSGVSAGALSYFGPRNLVYCLNSNGDSLAVIDVAADTLLTDVHVGHSPNAFLPIPDLDLMCVITNNCLLLPLDCATNLPLDTVLVGPYAVYGLAYDQRDDKLFAACLGSGECGMLAVVNGTTRELVGRHLIEGRPVEAFYNPADNKLYCLQEYARYGTVFDATAETVIATVEAPYGPYKTFVSPRSDRVYSVGYSGDVVVLDGRADTTVASLALGDAVWDVAYNPANDKLYFALWDSALAVLDCSTNTVVKRIDIYAQPGCGVCCDWRDNKVYASSHRTGRLFVIDGQIDSVIRAVPMRPGPGYLCYNARRNEVYCAIDGHWNDSVVCVLDCETDTVVATIVTGVHIIAPTYNPVSDKVYCLRNYTDLMSLAVIDCEEKRVVADLPLMYDNVLMEFDTVHNVTYVNWREGFELTVVADSDCVGLGGERQTHARLYPPPTIVHGVLFLPEAASRKSQAASLLDATGRKVLGLRPGANDVRALAPGVYFVKEHSVLSSQHSGRTAVGGERSAVHKVVVTH
jgi:DNA-binding beta-propeller fold protein YncE